MSQPLFRGAIPALVTPFRDGALDEAAFRALVERQIAAGVHGLVPVGTTGETATLSHEEHRRVVELCVEVAARRWLGEMGPAVAFRLRRCGGGTVDAPSFFDGEPKFRPLRFMSLHARLFLFADVKRSLHASHARFHALCRFALPTLTSPQHVAGGGERRRGGR